MRRLPPDCGPGAEGAAELATRRNHHFVVMLADGGVLDPIREGEFRLAEWSKALQVCGLIRSAI